MEDDDRCRSYEVGYARPPKEHRFKKGEPSANPLGRPHRSKCRTTYLRAVAAERQRYLDGGKERENTNLDLVVLAVRRAAAKGDVAGLKLFEWLSSYLEPEPGEPIPKGVLVLNEELSAEEWDAEYGPASQLNELP